MRDFASCYNEHAVKVSDSSCSGTGNATSAKDPSVQRSVTSFYRTKLSTRGVHLVRVTWSTNLLGQGFSLGVEEDVRSRPQHVPPHKPVHDATSSSQFRKKKGSRSYVSGDSVVEVYWDISSARYDTGPEPVGGFYVAVVVNGELGLRLGDMIMSVLAHVKRITADFSMIGRREQVVGSSRSVYLTRSRLGDGGRDHEIQIQCRGDGRDAMESELCVCVDQKKVVHVRRLRWNFRGNQTIFVDGVAVDMMWDVHDWWFSADAAPGCAAFMFRARGALESRLWLEDTAASKEEQEGEGKSSGFSLLIHAFRTPWQ